MAHALAIEGVALRPLQLAGPLIAGLVGLVLAFGGLALWSLLAPLSSAAIASGVVVVDSNRKSIQHLEGGMVRDILVRDGQPVQAGEVLVVLDDTRLKLTMSALKPRYNMTLAQRARLNAERLGVDDLAFPAELLNSHDVATTEILTHQRRLFLARRVALSSRIASLRNDAEKAKVTLAGLRLQRQAQARRIELTQTELQTATVLADKGYGRRARLLELNRALAELGSEAVGLDARAAETAKEIEHHDLEIERARNAFIEAVETDLQAVERDYNDLLERLETIADQRQRLEIRAPVSGTVVNLAVHTVGGVVAAGSPVLEIVPVDDPLVIDAQLRPIDVENVVPGMPAELRFAGWQDERTPKLYGRVDTVSADRLIDRATSQPYFLVRVTVDAGIAGRGAWMKPGMPVEVMLMKGARTPLDYLVAPLRDVMVHAMRE